MAPGAANPIFLAAALLGLATVLMRWPEFGTLLATVLLYLNLHSIAMRIHAVPPVVLAATAVLVVPALVKHWIVDRKGVILDRPFLLMLAFLASTIASSFFARDAQLALDWLVRYVAEGVLVYFLLINLVRAKDSLRRIIWVLVLCGAFLSSLTAYQELTGSYTQQFGGLARRNLRWETQRDFLPEGHDRTSRPTIRTAHRAYGPSLDANRYAQILVVLLPLGWCLIREERGVARKAVAIACSSLILAGVLLTYSRGAFVGMLAILCLLVTLRLATLRQVAIAATATILCAALLSPGYAERMMGLRGIEGLLAQTSGPAVESDSSERLRAALMRAAWKLFLDRPILGVGPGQFADGYAVDYASEFFSIRRVTQEQRAHSLYVELAAETGVIGFGVFAAVVIAALGGLAAARRRAAASDPFLANVSAALLVSIAAYLTTALFLHLTYQRYYWLLLALAGATVRLAEWPAIERQMPDVASDAPGA